MCTNKLLLAGSWGIGRLGCALIIGAGLTAALSVNGQTITTFAGGTFPADNTTPYSVPHPTAMTRDASGNLYVASGDPTNSQIGNNTSVVRGNRIFKIDTSGNVSLIAGNGQFPTSAPNNIPAKNAPISLPAGIAVDSSGNVYFSDESASLVFKVTAATGTLTIIAGNGANTGENIPAATAQVFGPTGLAIDGTARLFVGVKNENRVRVIDLSTNMISTFAGSGAPTTGTPMTRDTVVFQPRGLFYDGATTTLYMALPGFNEIRTASTSGQATIAGGGGGDFAGDGGPALAAKLRSPAGVAKDGTDVLIADTGNQRIRRINGGGTISTVAGSAPNSGGFTLQYGFSGDGGVATSALLDGPSDVRGTGSGNFVFVDRGNQRIRTVTGGTIATFAGNGSWGFNGDGIARTSAQLAFPARGEFDAAGNLYFAESGNNRVRRVDAGTGVITTVAGTGLAGYNGDGIAATSANLSEPSDVALDSAGNLYIADKNAARVRRVDAGTGTITTVAGTGVVGSSGDNGPATSAQLFAPTGILIDSSGTLLIADPTFGVNRVRKVIIGGNITAFAGAASGCDAAGATTGDGLAPTAAGACLKEPRDIVQVKVTGNGLVAGDILIAEESVVRRISSSNTLSTFAGSGSTSGDAVGTLANARFRDIESLALDSASNIFTVESFFRKVKKIAGGTGQVTAYAGTGAFNYDGDNQPATSAALFNPFGIFINPADEVHISDTRNHRVRKVVSIPDLVAIKFNNTSNAATTGAPWTWTITVANNGSAAANFTSAQVILTDDLPSSGLNYTLGAITNVSGVTNPGNISCNISSNTLTCTATGPVTIAVPNGHFDVPISVTSTAAATYNNPRAAGVCGADPANVVVEISDSNNSCADSVTVTDSAQPNMVAFKSNNVSGAVNPAGPWTWRISAENRGSANAVFADGQVIFRDDLPNTNINYSTPMTDVELGDFTDYDGVISCSIDGSKTVTCIASGGPVTFFGAFGANPGSSFYAEFTATPSADGTFTNPRSGGTCSVDPDNHLTESNEGDNSATDTVIAGTVASSPTPTATPTVAPTATATATATVAPTATATATATPTATATSTPTATATVAPTATATATATVAPTATATATATATTAPTATATATATVAPTATATATATVAPTATATATATATVAPTATATATSTPTATATVAATATATATATAAPTATATATATAAPSATATATGTPVSTPTATATATATATPTATPGSPTIQAINLSTRMRVQVGDSVGIGGFIISGATPKHVLLRGIGPSLIHYGISDVLSDPILELHGPSGFTTVLNDNWRDTQQTEIALTGLAPTNDKESAIDATLAPGAYTAVVRGKSNTSGVALVEVYDLNQASSKLGNLSTRALVGTGNDIVIAGLVLSDGSGTDQIVVRGIGPSLAPAFFPAGSVLADPTLELRDENGSLVFANNDWQDNPSQAAQLTAAGLAPSNNAEAAIAITLPPGFYTALLSGLNDGAGIGVVEIYDRGP